MPVNVSLDGRQMSLAYVTPHTRTRCSETLYFKKHAILNVVPNSDSWMFGFLAIVDHIS